jgi:hypothetical protein
MADDFDDDGPRRPLPPSDDGSGSGSGLKVILIVIGVVAIFGFCIVVSLVGLIVVGVREAGKSMTQTFAQIETQIRYDAVAQAMLAYQTKNGHFPMPAMKTKDGKRGLSWRVAILPELGHDVLYKQFKLDLAWNDPENMRLASQMPYQYFPPDTSSGQNTHLRMFVGNGAMFEFGKKTVTVATAADEIGITDGLSNTIMFVEATQSVLWIQPDELPFDPNGPLPTLGMPTNDYFFLYTADALGRPQPKTMKPKNLRAAITANGGETFTWD